MRRLGVASLGFARQAWLRTALASAGWQVVPFWTDCDAIGVWGRGGVAERGQAIATARRLPLVTIEDSFLRSVYPGRGPSAGLLIDDLGVHFSPRSRVEQILESRPIVDEDARVALGLIRHHRLSKYNHWTAQTDLPERFVLVIDQLAGDAALGGAGRAEFAAMLASAREDARVLGVPVLVRGHPAGRGLVPIDVARVPAGVNPWDLWPRCAGVHVWSSTLGYEAILAGLRPTIHGHPIYAGWGLSDDRQDFPDRHARLTAEQLFTGIMRDASHWTDPATGREEDMIRAVGRLASQVEAFRRTTIRPRLYGVSLWKRRRVAQFFPHDGPKTRVAWASRASGQARIEDGFLRSRGLGAALVPPVSLSFDEDGIHYDPSRPSRLERVISRSVDLPPAAIARAERLIERLRAERVAKYNLMPEPRPEPGYILLIGQVSDDASVTAGAYERTEIDLIAAARAAHPDRRLIFKPHPDVVAGLRTGSIPQDIEVVTGHLPDLLESAERVWTLTSLAGFEALLRNVSVTCLGQPFYAGWGLTEDLGGAPQRRTTRPTLTGLVHAALIDYPLYLDPRTGRGCGPEDILDWLKEGGAERPVRLSALGRLITRARLAARST
ncbi:capsular polysaccharide biosynthesis protein [Roseobacter sp. HKCCA0434]|uniref:capsular polysaccharide export protein, LipB/KpsS family n=1 Tax=Roseobacter sp. HKCCA0434 TaxID=3079297 RepID=UPI0029059DD6|nr:capsular polysaccharide biosynthesis protein [Roseobacter sp. HKCCA0434]